MFGILRILPPYPSPLPLLNKPWPALTIIAVYLLFITKLGRMFMKNREPYNLRRVLTVYNLVQVAYNAVLFSVIFYYMFIEPLYDLRCMETFPPDHKQKDLERLLFFAYYFNKILDLLDTVFFVLRKSYKQVTFLHVYHHVMMISCVYMIQQFYGSGGHFTTVAILNSFVHVVMYFYYYMSSRYPGVKANIWWKKYITLIQLIQFVIIFIHATYVMIFSKDCGFPKSMLWLQITQSIAMIYMFSKFYFKSYIQPTQRIQCQKQS